MQIEFNTQEMRESVRAIKRIFAQGPMGDEKKKDENSHDCLLATKGEGVVIESAKMGLYCRCKLTAEVTEEGKVVLPRHYLSETVYPGETVEFNHKEDKNELSYKSGTLTGKAPVSLEFDAIADQKPATMPKIHLTVPCETLRHGIKRISFTPTLDKDQSALKLQLKVSKNRLIMTTNDSYRATVYETKLEEEVEDVSIITLCPFFASVVNSIPSDAKVGIGFDEKGLRIKGGNFDIYQPAVQELEPTDIEGFLANIRSSDPRIMCKINVAETRKAVDSVSSTVPPVFGDVRLSVQFTEKGRATAKVESAAGSGSFQFEVSDVKTDDAPLLVSTKYIKEFLSLIEGEAQLGAWDRQIIIFAEALGTTLIMPQLT